MKSIIPATAVLIAHITTVPAFAAEPQDDMAELRNEIRALQEAQAEMREELAEIRTLLEGRSMRNPTPGADKPAAREVPKPFEPRELDVTDASSMGDPNAPVTLIEYMDYTCLYCARYARQTLPKLIEHYVRSGRVRLIAREFPIPNLHPQATSVSLAALCAGAQGAYWEMHDQIFANQRRLATVDLESYAGRLAIDQARFRECLEGQEFAARIARDGEEARTLGVKATPSFALGRTRDGDPDRVWVTHFFAGARDYDFFAQHIDSLLTEETSPGGNEP